jgi:hypothetical protein
MNDSFVIATKRLVHHTTLKGLYGFKEMEAG